MAYPLGHQLAVSPPAAPAETKEPEKKVHISAWTLPVIGQEPLLHEISSSFQGGREDDGFFILKVKAKLGAEIEQVTIFHEDGHFEPGETMYFAFDMKTCESLCNQLGHAMDLSATNSIRRRMPPKFNFVEPKIVEEKLTSPVKPGAKRPDHTTTGNAPPF